MFYNLNEITMLKTLKIFNNNIIITNFLKLYTICIYLINKFKAVLIKRFVQAFIYSFNNKSYSLMSLNNLLIIKSFISFFKIFSNVISFYAFKSLYETLSYFLIIIVRVCLKIIKKNFSF